MEKYFIVTEESSLNKDYFDYLENRKVVNEHFKVFADNQNIKASEYYCNSKELYIVPTKEDLENFSDKLKSGARNGLRAFKKNSKIGKEWANSLKDIELKVLRKPSLGFECLVYGHFKERLFDIDNVLYGSLEAEHTFIVPKGIKEIKASEFFKIIEDYEEINN